MSQRVSTNDVHEKVVAGLQWLAKVFEWPIAIVGYLAAFVIGYLLLCIVGFGTIMTFGGWVPLVLIPTAEWAGIASYWIPIALGVAVILPLVGWAALNNS
jgi:hypothetical protein